MTRSQAAALGAAFALAVSLSACAGAEEPAPEASLAAPSAAPRSQTPTPAPTPAAVDTSNAQNTGEPMEELPEDSGAAEEVPVWDAAAEQEAATRAVAFMRAFGRPTLPADEWLRGIQGLMAPEAVDYFAYVDPINVPVTSVEDEAEVRETGSAYVAEVVVSTDAGPYLVTLTRRTGADPFLVASSGPLE